MNFQISPHFLIVYMTDLNSKYPQTLSNHLNLFMLFLTLHAYHYIILDIHDLTALDLGPLTSSFHDCLKSHAEGWEKPNKEWFLYSWSCSWVFRRVDGFTELPELTAIRRCTIRSWCLVMIKSHWVKSFVQCQYHILNLLDQPGLSPVWVEPKSIQRQTEDPDQMLPKSPVPLRRRQWHPSPWLVWCLLPHIWDGKGESLIGGSVHSHTCHMHGSYSMCLGCIDSASTNW